MTLASLLHLAVGRVLDLLLWPVADQSPSLQAAFLGLPAALLALEGHRRSANQEAISRAKDRIKGHLLELRLFRDDLRVLLRAQCQILRHNGVYLMRSLVPFAVLFTPFFLMLVQLEARFGWSPVEPGAPTLLTADVEVLGRLSDLPIEIETGDGLRSELPALRIERTRQLVWRLAAAEPGVHPVTVRVAGRPTRLELAVAGRGEIEPIPALYRADQLGSWTVPSAALPQDSPLRSLSIAYPRAGGEWLGLSQASWIFVASTALFALALRKRFGVVF